MKSAKARRDKEAIDLKLRAQEEAKFKALSAELASEYEGSAFIEYDYHSEGISVTLWGIEHIEDAREILALYEKRYPMHLTRKG